MAADTILARELLALQDQLSAAPRRRAAPAVEVEAEGQSEAAPDRSDVAGEERQIAEQLHDLASLIKEYAEEAEQTVAEHPTASVIGALLLGVLIGRLLGKR